MRVPCAWPRSNNSRTERRIYESQRRNFTRVGAYEVDALLSDHIVRFLPTAAAGDMLDYGAGNSPYRAKISCDRYVRADLTQNTVGDIDCIIRLGESLPLSDADFELILLLDVLEHVSDPIFVLGELRRLLKPGGKAILSLPFMYREHETPHDYARYTAFGISTLVATQGGRILRLKKVGNVACTLVSLFIERGIANGEVGILSRVGRLANRLLNMSLWLFRHWFEKKPPDNAGIYHHLLLEIDFPEKSV